MDVVTGDETGEALHATPPVTTTAETAASSLTIRERRTITRKASCPAGFLKLKLKTPRRPGKFPTQREASEAK
jgi:hypothetical protein